MKSVLETILIKHYGFPEVLRSESKIEYWWKRNDDRYRTVLYSGLERSPLLSSVISKYENIYGDFIGGILLGGSLKIASLAKTEIYGLYTLGELQGQLELCDVYKRDPKINFFMDAANVWFYGFRDNLLFVYDIETNELDEIGEIAPGLESVFDEWEASRNQ